MVGLMLRQGLFATLLLSFVRSGVAVGAAVPLPVLNFQVGADSPVFLTMTTIPKAPGSLCVGTVGDCFFGLNIGETPSYRLTVGAFYNPDPFLVYFVSFQNLSPAPVTLSFLFSTPIVSGIYDSASSSIGFSITDGGSDGAGAVYAVDSSLDAADMGVDLLALCPGPPAGSNICGSSVSSSFGPAFGSNLSASLNVFVSGLDLFAATGRIDVTSHVPEPGSFGLAVFGILLSALRLSRHFPRT